MAVQFPAEVQSVRFRQRWHGVSRDGEGEAVYKYRKEQFPWKIVCFA